MATLEEIGQALKNAHDAGDIDAAKKLADAYHAQQQQQEKKTLNPTSQNESPVDVAARMGVRTLAAFPETVIDMPLTAGNWIGNKIDAAVNLPPADFNTHPVKDLADKAISMMGVSPQSSGSTENIAQAGLSALTGAGLAKTLRSSLGKYAMRQAAGAASAQTANEITQDSDLSDELKIGLGIGAGMLGSNMMGAA
jgi:hypothetical protein